MLFPVRCFTCNGMLPSDVYEAQRKQGVPSEQILGTLRITRMCCRRMFISFPHALEDSLLHYPNVNTKEPELFLDTRCLVSVPRTMGCD